MADNCTIEWVAALARHHGLRPRSLNPILGCSRASDGCRNCYAAGIAHRFGGQGQGVYAGLTQVDGNGVPRFNGTLRFSKERLRKALSWREPSAVFLGDMSDIFHPAVEDAWLDQIMEAMDRTPQHIFLLLTKRPERAAGYLARHLELMRENPFATEADARPLPNVLIGCTAEDQPRADERRQHMERIAAAGWRTFVSYEPALGPVDWTGWEFLDWLISGGESGRHARPSHPDWHRVARDFCAAAGVPFFFKQWGEWIGATRRPGEYGTTSAATGEVRYWPGNETAKMHTWGDRLSSCAISFRVGKSAAGRMLDGVEHNALPRMPAPMLAAAE